MASQDYASIVSVASSLFQEYFPSDAVSSWFSSVSITAVSAQQEYIQSIYVAGPSGLTAVPTDLVYQFIAYESTIAAILQGQSETPLAHTTSSFAPSSASLATTPQITTSNLPSPSSTINALPATQTRHINVSLVVGLPLGLLLMVCLGVICLLIWKQRPRTRESSQRNAHLENVDVNPSQCRTTTNSLSWSNKGKKCFSHNDVPSSAAIIGQPKGTSSSEREIGLATSNIQHHGQITQPHYNTSYRNDKYGLFLLNPQTLIPDGVEPEKIYWLDIVAVHGITGDAYNTWTHKNGNFWLRDILPKALPGARVFSFGYPAEVFFSLEKGDLESFARSLLEDLKRERREEDQRRPIMFICHSMGGIVVKKALITALIDNEIYGRIRKSVIAILFLGTPHRGSEETSLPLVLADIVNVALAGTSRFVGSMQSDRIRSLQKDSKILKEISTNFRHQARDIKIASFIEQIATPPAKNRVVDDNTGIMGIPGERIVPMPNCDHKSICRFSAETSSSYKTVWGVLQDWADTT